MIKITNLSNKKNNRNYSFSDFHLDMEEKKVSSNKVNSSVAAGNDIVADYDEKAIINSITNILLQRRYLTPSFNINLPKYIGKPITDMAALSLGQDIEKGLALFERRVKVKKILVLPDKDNNLYKIYLLIEMPNFSNRVMTLEGLLDNVGRLSFINKESL